MSSKPKRAAAAACALFLLCGVTPALADAESEALFNEFVAFVDASAEWSASVSIVRSEGDHTIAEGIVFGRTDPHVAISIETLRLRDFAARADGGFGAAEIEMGGGAVITEFMEATIPSATIAEMSMPSFAGLTFDIQHMMTSIARFYSVASAGEFEAIAAPEVTIVQRQAIPDATGPIETRVSYRNLSFGPLADGILERQTVGPLTASIMSPGSPDFTIEIAGISAERMDLSGFAHVLDPSRYREGRGDNIWRPLFSRAAYSAVSGRGEDGSSFRIDEAVVENIDGRQPAEPFTALWDRMLDPAVPQEAKNDLALEALAAMFGAWRVGTVRVDGVAAAGPGGEGTFALAGVTMTGMSNEGLDSLLVKDLRAEAPGGFAALRSLELSGFVPPDLKALMQFAALEKDVDADKHAAAVRSTFAALPRIAHLGMQGAAAGKSEAEAITLDGFALDFADWADIFAGATDLRIDGLTIPTELMQLEGESAEVMEKLGYDNLVLGMSFSDRWSPETGIDTAKLALSLKDAAQLEFSYKLRGLTADWLLQATAAAGGAQGSEAALMAMLDNLSLESAALRVTDQTLLDAAFGLAAEKQGLTVEGPAYRQQMRAALPFLMATVLPSGFAKKVSPPLQQFLEGGGTLIAEIAPAQPIGILALIAGAADPIGLTDLLKLTLSTEPAR